MKYKLIIGEINVTPNKEVSDFFVTPVVINNRKDSWSAKVHWGMYNSRRPGDVIVVELIPKAAPALHDGDRIDIMIGTHVLASGHIISDE